MHEFQAVPPVDNLLYPIPSKEFCRVYAGFHERGGIRELVGIAIPEVWSVETFF
jgi:hypothetical protein